MLSLNDKEKEYFLKLSRSSDTDILKDYLTRIIKEVSDIDNLTTDIIKNAQTVKFILKSQLLDLLEEHTVEQGEEDSYD